MSESDGNTSVESRRTSKRMKKNPEKLPVLLIVFGFSISEIGQFVSDHPVLDGIKEGHYSANKRIDLFFTDDMQKTLLDDIGEDIGQLGADPLDDYSKQAVLFELFFGVAHGGRMPRRGEVFRSVITLHVEPARYRFLK